MRKSVVDDPAVIKEIMDKAEVLWLALVDEDGPYSLPINFAEEDGIIYIHSGKKGRKAEALNTGNPVGFSAVINLEAKTGEDACSFGYRFRSITGQGTPRLLEGDERMHGLETITIKYAGEKLPYDHKYLPITAVYAISVDSVTARVKD